MHTTKRTFFLILVMVIVVGFSYPNLSFAWDGGDPAGTPQDKECPNQGGGGGNGGSPSGGGNNGGGGNSGGGNNGGGGTNNDRDNGGKDNNGGGGNNGCQWVETGGRNEKGRWVCPSGPTGACSSQANNNCEVPLTNVGRYVGGVCNATRPPDSACPLPVLTITPSTGIGGVKCDANGNCSQLINKNKSCSIAFTVNSATRCTVTGPNFSQSLAVPPKTLTVVTPTISVTSLYTIRCQNGPVVYTAKTFNCKVNPTFEEF